MDKLNKVTNAHNNISKLLHLYIYIHLNEKIK